MRLYRFAETGQWFGTQAEASAAIREKGGRWSLVEVPTDKAGLIAFLNAEAVRTAAFAAQPVPSGIADLMPPLEGTVAIEEEIGRADLANAIRLASHALGRVQEHLNAAERRAK